MEFVPFNLYHGTSSLYLDSIVKHGLGAYNPLIELKAYQWCRDIYDLTTKYLKDWDLFAWSWQLEEMCEQSSIGNFNAQHGQTYLASGMSRAKNYAVNNKWGGELISYPNIYYKQLKTLDDVSLYKELERLSTDYQEIIKMLNSDCFPILIELADIPIYSILDEKGKNPSEAIHQVRQHSLLPFEDENYSVSFRLAKPVSLNHIKVFKINDDESLSLISP